MWHLMFWKDISLMSNSLLPACLHATSVCVSVCVSSGEHLSRFVYICVCGRETESEQISMQMKSEQWHCLFCYCHWNINWKKCSAQNSRLLCLHSDCWSAQKCRYVIDISLFWIRPKEGQADVIYCSLSISFLRDMNTLIQMSTITFPCHLTKNVVLHHSFFKRLYVWLFLFLCVCCRTKVASQHFYQRFHMCLCACKCVSLRLHMLHVFLKRLRFAELRFL